MEDSFKIMTKFYRPLVGKSFQLRELVGDISETEKEIKLDADHPVDEISIGIADGAKRNKEFMQVLNYSKRCHFQRLT